MPNLTKSRILLTGSEGFLGQHVVRELKLNTNPENIVVPTRAECDLMNPEDCQRAVAKQDIIIHAAGRVGGIVANRDKPGEFFYENALMGIQLLEAARQAGVKKFVQVGTVCEYPKFPTHTPTPESDLWAGYPEETSAPYGLAKKMLLVHGQAYQKQYGMNVIHLLMVNLYGPSDHFGAENAHVIAAFIDRFSRAKKQNLPEVVCWGTGSPTREFLYVKDAARGIVSATQDYNSPEPVNLGSGQEISIKDLAETIANLIGYKGKIIWDTSKPDGQPRRLFDSSRAEQEFGFRAETSFEEGLKETIAWYQEHVTQRKEIPVE